jgi:outer membrane lipoprotein-sorting protein
MSTRPMFTRRTFTSGLLASAASIAATHALASPSAADEKLPALDDVLARIAQARASLKTLVGPFTQERKIGLLATKVASTGKLTLALPDKLRWELFAPDAIVYWIAAGGLAYKSTNGGGRLPSVVGSAAAALDDLRILLAGDLALLRSRHELHLVAATPTETILDAFPRADAGASTARITFTLGADLAKPKKVLIAFGPKDRTEIVFGALERDVTVDPQLFRPPV